MNDTPPSLPDIMTVPETAAYLKLSRSKVYSLIKMGKMPHVRIGHNVRVRQKDLMRWLEDQVSPPQVLEPWYQETLEIMDPPKRMPVSVNSGKLTRS